LPPAGDLRAPRDALLAHADHVVLVDATPRGAVVDGTRVTLVELRALRLGIFTALARPERIMRALERSGIVASTVVRAADHGPLTANLRRHLLESPVDRWVVTEKCATHLEALGQEARLAILDGSLVLPEVLRGALCVARSRSACSDDAIRVAGARVGYAPTCVA
jgi:tetraacyldisaccharide-1-P 4'-kinase